MHSKSSDKRKSRGCPAPIVYLSLQMTAFLLLLYIAKALTVPMLALIIAFILFTVFALNRTSKVCTRQRIRALYN